MKPLSDQPMAFKLSFYSGVVLSIIFLIFISIMGPIMLADLNRQLERGGMAQAIDIADRLDNIMIRAEASADVLAQALESSKLTPDEIKNLIVNTYKNLTAIDPRIVAINVSFEPYMLYSTEEYCSFLTKKSPDGTVFADKIDGEKMRYFYRDWYVMPKNLGFGLWANPFMSEGGLNRWLLVYSTPFYLTDAAGNRVFGGVMVVDIDIEQLRPMIHEITLKGVGYGFLMTKFADIVVHQDAEIENNQTLFSLLYEQGNNKSEREQARKMMADTNEGTAVFNTLPFFSHGTQIFFDTTVRNGWKVCVAVPANWVHMQLSEYLLYGLLIYLLVMAAAILGICLVARRMSKPLVQLTKAARKIGQGDFTAELPGLVTGDEIGELSRSFEVMRKELIDYMAQLERNVSVREKIEAELNAAKTIQCDILPKLLPPLPDCPQFSVAPALKPARAIGGDMYDIFFLTETKLLLMIGDVSGKGIAAALFMAIAETLQRNISSQIHNPAAIIRRLNSMLAQNNNAMMFITCWLGILDLDSGELEYCNAGHNPPLCLRRDGSCEDLVKLHGAPLGIMECEYKQSVVTLDSGDTLMLYTDGVTEAFNSRNEMYTLSHLRDLSCQLIKDGKTPTEMLNVVLDDVADFAVNCEQSDDITLLILRFNRANKQNVKK